jgi:addiction module RelB/DinJ family antitoxin
MPEKAEVVRARVSSSLKEEASTILGRLNVSMSDLFREVLVKVVAEQNIPFAVRTRTGLSEPLRRHLIADNIAEVHKSWWNSRYAELDKELLVEETKPTPDLTRIEALGAMLDEHEKVRFKPEVTRARLLGETEPVVVAAPKSTKRKAAEPEPVFVSLRHVRHRQNSGSL